MIVFDPKTNSSSGIYTGLGTVEVAYVPEGAQAFSTNYTSGTLTIAALGQTDRNFSQNQFVNIKLNSEAANLHARRTENGTEIFIVRNGLEHLIEKITIAADVRGIDGLEKPGACQIVNFNMASKAISSPEPCNFLSAKESYLNDIAHAQESLKELSERQKGMPAAVEKAKEELVKAQQSDANAEDLSKAEYRVARMERSRQWVDSGVADVRTAIEVLGRLASEN